MQALAERLEETLRGAGLVRFVPIQFSAAKTFDPDPAALVGRSLSSVGRRGKFLVFDFDGMKLLIHLSQGGRVDVEEPPKTTRPKNGVARAVFEGPKAFFVKEFGTQRKAGWWILAPGDEGPLTRLGPEPFSDGFESWVMETDDRRRLHTALRDQRTVAGIGRGYVDEILHEVQLSPYATLASLDGTNRRRLLSGVRDILERGLALERKRRGGLPTKLPGRFFVHGHAGEPCPRCEAELKRVSYEDYEIVYCPICQTGGKLLADRRLSRIVK